MNRCLSFLLALLARTAFAAESTLMDADRERDRAIVR